MRTTPSGGGARQKGSVSGAPDPSRLLRFPQVAIDPAGLIDCIEAAESYERALALKCYRLRKLILCMKAQREMLDGLVAFTGDRSAAA